MGNWTTDPSIIGGLMIFCGCAASPQQRPAPVAGSVQTTVPFGQPGPFIERGLGLLQQRRFAEGSDAIIVGQSIDDWRRRAMRGIGFSLVELDRLEEAAAIYREVLAINPSDAQARRELDSIAPRLQHL